MTRDAIGGAGVGVNDWIRQTIEAPRRGVARQLAIAALCVAVAFALRLGLKVWAPTGIPYITFFPLLAVAGVLGGRIAGVATLVAGAVLGAMFFVELRQGLSLPPSGWAGVFAFFVSGGLIVWLCDLLTGAIRALRDANNQEHLLALELQHRVKNTLAIVQAIAHQTLATQSGPGFRAAFTDRLVALGQAHNLLSEGAWRSVELDALIRGSLSPFLSDGRRVQTEGPKVQLPPDLVVDLALRLHELGANATKHGALSVPGGHVELRWAWTEPGIIRLRWSEHGGPIVQAPSHRGFGSRLLERGLARPGGKPAVAIEYRPEGLCWTIHFPVAAP